MFLLIMRLPARELPLHFSLGHFLLGLVRPFEPLHFLRTCWYMRPITAIFAAAAVAVPWYWAVGLATDGQFLEGFFWEHNVRRATESMEGHRGSALWFYPAAILLGFFPWSCFAIPLSLDAAAQARRRDGWGPGCLLAICWVAVYVGLFSIAQTKLPSYITPCYPGLALLAGSYVDRWTRDRAAVSRWWLPAAFAVLAVAGAAFAVAVPQIAERYLPGEEWLGLLGLTLVAGGVTCIGLALVHNYKAAAATFAGLAVLFATLLFAVGAQRADQHQTSHVILRTIFQHSDNPTIASFKILEPSWVFYAGQPIRSLVGNGNSSPDNSSPELFFLTNSEGFLITTDKHLPELGRLPPGVGVLAETDLFLKDQRLVLLGYERSTVARQPANPPWK
jgi:4-amino-4-deoxy-L-arabinose transferase-like glycosyltransferase